MAFNTPDSITDRELKLEAYLNKKDLTLELNLASPWKKANMKGTFDFSFTNSIA